MDKIWDGNFSRSEVIARCDGDEKNNDHAEPTQSNAKRKRPLYFNSSVPNAVLITVFTRTHFVKVSKLPTTQRYPDI